MGKRHPFLQPSGAGGMLEQDNIFRLALKAPEEVEIGYTGSIDQVADDHGLDRIFSGFKGRPDFGFEIRICNDGSGLRNRHQRRQISPVPLGE